MKTRKTIRLKNYDYGQNGAYFITICVQNRLPILAEISELPVGASNARPYGIGDHSTDERLCYKTMRQNSLAEILL